MADTQFPLDRDGLLRGRVAADVVIAVGIRPFLLTLAHTISEFFQADLRARRGFASLVSF